MPDSCSAQGAIIARYGPGQVTEFSHNSLLQIVWLRMGNMGVPGGAMPSGEGGEGRQLKDALGRNARWTGQPGTLKWLG